MLKVIVMTVMTKSSQWNQPIAQVNDVHSFIPTCLYAEGLYDTRKNIRHLGKASFRGFLRYIRKYYTDTFCIPFPNKPFGHKV
jgi:hypothetical protein